MTHEPAGDAGSLRRPHEPSFVEDLVAECVRRHGEEGDAAIERICAAHPGEASEIRARLDALRRIGMFDEDEQLPHFEGYRTVRVLGQGGMGVVYLAIDERLGRPVALKVLRKELEASGRARERFLREIRAIARAAHPGIVTILDVADQAGTAYFTMQYVEGINLAALLAILRAEARGNGFPAAERLRELVGALPGKSYVEAVSRWTLEVARALDHVHEAGILHRDVKPSNVLVGRDGRARLFDFGLASLAEDPTLTLSGDFLGTPHYVSPEQVRGDAAAVDRRTDVYSIGVTLYELLTFEPPFQGPSTQHVFHEIEEGRALPPRRRNAAVPADLDLVCRTAMAPDPERRYRTAGVLADDLERSLAGRAILARPPSLSYRTRRFVQRNRLLVGSAAAILVALVSGLAVSTWALARASSAAGLARQRLTETERLSDILLLRELVQEAETLYPPNVEVAARMRDWLTRAAELFERKSVHAGSVARWRAEHGVTDGQDEATLASVPLMERWRYRSTLELLAGYQGLERLCAGVRERLAFASEVERRTLVDPAREWHAAIEAIAASEAYEGLRLKPQLGLVPLGPDPESGLLEFWHVQSGTRPERDPRSGRVVCGEETGIVLVLLPGGAFEMGAVPLDHPQAGNAWNLDPAAENREWPVHEVELGPFFLSKFELTQGQWRRITGLNPSSYNPSLVNPVGRPTLAHPVESVSWLEVELLLGRMGLVIPTEAQWEYAARAGSSAPWFTGEEPESLDGFANLGDRTARDGGAPADYGSESWLEDGAVVHAPVGSYAPNAFGLHDTAGNVWEWCRDRFAFYDEAAAAGPEGERVGGAMVQDRIHRGGSFKTSARGCRSSYRNSDRPEAKGDAIGIRPGRRIEP